MTAMTTLKAGTRVRIEALIGPNFESDWSTKGRVVRHHRSWRGKEDQIPAGYHTIKYDDGACLMVHISSLRTA